jgi:hypothetical protein
VLAGDGDMGVMACVSVGMALGAVTDVVHVLGWPCAWTCGKRDALSP